jgi:hypothetical protein
LPEAIAVLESAAQRNDSLAIVRGLQNLIPEYQPAQAHKSSDSTEVEGFKPIPRAVPSFTPATN